MHISVDVRMIAAAQATANGRKAARAEGREVPIPSGPTASVAVGPPPFLLPGEHFAGALLYLVAGAAGLVVIAPDLARGFFLSPRVAGVTHLFTLGWITTSIMGALYQFLPVALGEPIRSIRAAHVSFALHVIGLSAFVGGLVLAMWSVMLCGAAMFGTGVLVFVGNLAATLRRARRRDVTWWALAGAAFFLTITLLLGLALAGNLRWGYLSAGRYAAIGVHLHVALAGWVLLVMIGVGQRLLPMFLLSHGAGDRMARAAVALVASGAGVLAFLHHAPALVSVWLPALLIAGGCAAFLLQARSFYVRRHRPVLDPGMRLAAVALALIGVALVAAGPVLLSVGPPRIAGAYVLAAVLGSGLFVAAHYYKIVPFLVWYHRFGPLAGRQAVPRVAELYSARAAYIAAAALGLGTTTLIATIGLGAPAAARGAAAVFLAGVVIEALQMLKLWRTRP